MLLLYDKIKMYYTYTFILILYISYDLPRINFLGFSVFKYNFSHKENHPVQWMAFKQKEKYT